MQITITANKANTYFFLNATKKTEEDIDITEFVLKFN